MECENVWEISKGQLRSMIKLGGNVLQMTVMILGNEMQSRDSSSKGGNVLQVTKL